MYKLNVKIYKTLHYKLNKYKKLTKKPPAEVYGLYIKSDSMAQRIPKPHKPQTPTKYQFVFIYFF